MNITSYFSPFSKQFHSYDHFKQLSGWEKCITLTVTVLAALVSIPILGLGGVAAFRAMVGHYKKIDPKNPKMTHAEQTASQVHQFAQGRLSCSSPELLKSTTQSVTYINVTNRAERLGYTTVKPLGQGMVAPVNLVKDQAGNTFAMKGPQYAEIARKEFDLGKRLDHTHIMKMHYLAAPNPASEEEYFLVCEYVDGEILRDFLKKPYTIDQARNLVKQSLEAAHHMVSRDVYCWDLTKLENTMITREGNLKFIDFGSYLNEEDVRYVADKNLGLAWDVSIRCLGDLLHQAKMILEPFQKSIKTPFINRLFKELNWVSVNPSNPSTNLDQILDQVGDMFNVGDQDALPDFSAIFQTLAPPQRPALRELPPLKNGQVMQDRKEHLLSFLKELIDDPELVHQRI